MVISSVLRTKITQSGAASNKFAAAGRPLQDLMTFPQRYCGVSTLRLTPDGLAVERVDELLWR